MAKPDNSDQLFKTSYSRGVVVFAYGLAWLGTVAAGYGLLGQSQFSQSGALLNIALLTAAAMLAGALGGATATLSRLAQHVSVTLAFTGQPLLTYFLLPLSGALAGLLTFLLIALPASLLINFASSGQILLTTSLTTPAFIALQLLLAWIAGLYQLRAVGKVRAVINQAQQTPAPVEPEPAQTDPFSFKQWYRRQQLLERWSYTWGLFIVAYGLVWLGGLTASIAFNASVFDPTPAGQNAIIALIIAAWPAAAAGGIGGAVSMLNNLYHQVATNQTFDRQHLMLYLVQPAVGCTFGLAIYLLIAAGYLSLAPLTVDGSTAVIVGTASVVMVQMALGWIAGFRQDVVTNLLLKVVGDAVSFLKLVLRLLNPFTLFNSEKRQAVLQEISERTDLFKPATENASPKSWVSD